MINATTLNQDGTGALACIRRGNFASTAANQAGRITRTNTALLRWYADDAGVVLTGTGSVPDIRNGLYRTLLTKDNTGGHIRVHSLMGQVKAYDAFWNTEIVSAVHGRIELVRSAAAMTLGGYGVTAAVLGIPSVSGAVTVNTNHILAGVAAISDFRATLTQTGKVAGFYVGAYDTTNWSDATARTTWGYGLLIADSAAATGIAIGTTTAAAISFTGAVVKGFDFSSATSTYASSDNAFIGIGTYTVGYQVANTASTSFIPIQVNLHSTASAGAAGQQVAAARLRVNNETNVGTNTAIHVLQLRSDIAQNCYAAACLNASMNVSANVTVAGETVQSGYFSITGAGVITCSAVVNVLEASYRGTSPSAGVDNVCQLSINATGCAVTNILSVLNTAGTATNMIDLAGTATFGIKVSATIPDLLQLTAGSAGISCVFTNAAIPAVNTSHALRIDIDATPHYIPVFSDLSWGS